MANSETGTESTSGGASIESRADYKKNPSGQYKYWSIELQSSMKRLKKWHKAGDRVVNRFLDKQGVDALGGADTKDRARPAFSLNLFHSNTTTLNSLLYGNLPQVDVSRKHSDANDDAARVAAEMMERLLNCDISANPDKYDSVLRSVLQDRLLPGLGCARVRYEVQTTGEGTAKVLVSENAPIDYFHWRDILWGWGRNWSEIPWLAYRTYLTKKEVGDRFGKEAADGCPLKKQIATGEDDGSKDPELDSAWMKAEIWEIWDKVKKKVCWVCIGYDKVLEVKPDPLKLTGFFPSPPFFIANATTSLYIPTPDFHLSQDLYNEIDILQTRIAIITEAVKVIGVYDKSAEGVERMFNEGVDNKLIPVDNWAMFAEKGGIRGQIDWFPIQDIVNALDKLRQLRDETIGLLQQVTGMSDLMQGGLQNQYEGVGQSQIKARFGSIRIQKLQDDFAAFASSLMQIKAEVIAIHFDAKTIVMQSNMMNSFDKDKIPEAVALIKKPKVARLRITIRPESVAMTDFAELQNERTAYLNAISTFMQSAAPLIETDPAAKPFLLQLLQWGLAGFKGSSEIEGVIDKAIEASIEEAKNAGDKPDPEQQKMQQAMQLEDKKHQSKMTEIQAKSQADIQMRNTDLQADIQTEMARHKAKMAEVQASSQGKLTEINAKYETDVSLEEIQAGLNIQQSQSQQEGEIRKDAATASFDIQKEQEKTRLKIREMTVGTAGKIKEMIVSVDAELIKSVEKREPEDGGKGDNKKI
jgi:hypothetical protein